MDGQAEKKGKKEKRKKKVEWKGCPIVERVEEEEEEEQEEANRGVKRLQKAGCVFCFILSYFFKLFSIIFFLGRRGGGSTLLFKEI